MTLDKSNQNGRNRRSKSKINRLEMYKTRPIRDRKGKVIYEAFKSKDVSHEARIQPDRHWFMGTRTVGQSELTKFREAMAAHKADPRSILVKPAKVPFSLLTDLKIKKSPLLFESFDSVIGKRATRKRPNLGITDLDELLTTSQKASEQYKVENDSNIKKPEDEEFFRQQCRDGIYSKGQSNRIWSELYKVIDCSDVVVEVLDSRDPMGTRTFHVEKHIKKNCPNKHILLLLNKVDLVPVWSLSRWIAVLSKEFPVVAFHASIDKPFGKGSLIQVLRMYQRVHFNKPQISVGFIGYPNVGKSSVINTLRHKRVCPAAPIPGHTKVWQYITLFKDILLVDCPGIVCSSNDSESDIVLKGIVRIENLHDAPDHVEQILKRVSQQHLSKIYKISQWNDHIDFLTQLAYKFGQLLPKNKPNIHGMAKIVLRDWLHGKIPYFVPPPLENDATANNEYTNTKDLPVNVLHQENLKTRKEFLTHVQRQNHHLEYIADAPECNREPLSPPSHEDEESIDWDQIYNEHNDEHSNNAEMHMDCQSAHADDNFHETQNDPNFKETQFSPDGEEWGSISSSCHSKNSDLDFGESLRGEDEFFEKSSNFQIEIPSEKLTTIKLTSRVPKNPTKTPKNTKNKKNQISIDAKIINSGLKHFKRSKHPSRGTKKKRRNPHFEIVK